MRLLSETCRPAATPCRKAQLQRAREPAASKIAGALKRGERRLPHRRVNRLTQSRNNAKKTSEGTGYHAMSV